MAEKTVMIVDDDPSTVIYLKPVLSEEGYRVLTADRGSGALELLRTEIPDLVLLDVHMPGMSGYEVLERIRSEDRTSNIPVIFLTVKDTLADEEKGLSEGVIDYLSKDILRPDRVQILRYRLRNFFSWQENERLRGVLATIVSANHEINNPLMVILGNADLLRLRGFLGEHPEGLEALERISDSCQRVKEVLERISKLASWGGTAYLEGVEMLDLSRETGSAN